MALERRIQEAEDAFVAGREFADAVESIERDSHGVMTLLIVVVVACNLTAPRPPATLACWAPDRFGVCGHALPAVRRARRKGARR
jgi:hypothetical protein